MINILNKPDTVTDGDFLFRGLGSFWTTLFQEKETLKGYTKGQAEEISQRYIDLIEVIRSFSVKDIDILHTERWTPLVLERSKLNQIPFVFESGDAVFGNQPELSTYYAGLTFKFGGKKTTNQKAYQYATGRRLASFGLIADKIINPSTLFIRGIDVVVDSGVLTFNSDIFEVLSGNTFSLFDEAGEERTYTDSNGNTQPDLGLILWVYNGQFDQDSLAGNFGNIFSLFMPSSVQYKEILQSLTSLYVKGPTITNLQQILSACAGIPFTLHHNEIVEELFSDGVNTFVITDKEAYKIPKGYAVKPLTVGNSLPQGTMLTTGIELFDSLTSILGWWKRTGLIERQLAFSRSLFLGDYTNQLSFSVEPDLVTLDAAGNIKFPVLGVPHDVALFNEYLNSDSTRKAAIKEKFELVSPGDSHLIFPLDFVLENFFRQNSMFIKLNISDHDTLAKLLLLLPIFKSLLPPYVYCIIAANTSGAPEVYENLNGELVEVAFDTPVDSLNCDGTSATGEFEKLSPFYYNDVMVRLFEIDKTLPTQPFETVTSPDSSSTSDAIMISGNLRISPNVGDSTAQFNKFLFLDFS